MAFLNLPFLNNVLEINFALGELTRAYLKYLLFFTFIPESKYSFKPRFCSEGLFYF